MWTLIRQRNPSLPTADPDQWQQINIFQSSVTVSPCLYQWFLLPSHFSGTWLRPILTSAECPFFFGVHCDFWYKQSSESEATCFWPVQPNNLHIHASLAFIHHELPPTQQMFRWGVLSSNLFYVDLLISDACGAQSRSSTCQPLPLTASTSFSQCAKLRKRKCGALYPGAHMEMLESVHNHTNTVFMFSHKLTLWFGQKQFGAVGKAGINFKGEKKLRKKCFRPLTE